MKLLQRNYLLAIAIGVVVVALVYLFAIAPLQEDITSKSEGLYQERIRAAVAELQQQNTQTTKREYERLQSQSETFEQFFVAQSDVLLFIASLEAIASEVHVEQEIEQLQTPEGDAKTSSMIVSVVAPFQNILSYLQEIESSPFYLNITRLQVSATEGGLVHATFQVIISWR